MRILGLDIGSRSIKAVEVDSAFGRYEIHEYHEVKIEGTMTQEQALSRLIQGLPRPPDRIATTLPTHEVTFRNLSLPTREKKAIATGVAFELEDELPFSADQIVFDYAVLSQGKQGSELHISATLKRNVAALLDRWAAQGLDPELITTESWALRTLMNKIVPTEAQERPLLLAHIGHERTLLYIHHAGKPISIREIAWGGRDLNLAICQKYQIPLDQAEAAKLDHGFVVPLSQEAEISPDQMEFSNTLRETLLQLIFELKQADLSAKSLTADTVARVYVSGGTSLLPGLIKALEEELKKPVLPAQGLTSAASSGVTYSEHSDAVFVLAAATALSVVKQDKINPINFRKGEFAVAGKSMDINFASLRKPLLATAAIAACAITSLAVQTQYYQGRQSDLDGELKKRIRAFFGQVSNSVVDGYIADPDKLRAAIEKELKKERELAALFGPNKSSPLDYLKELSAAVPKDVVVDMTLYHVGAAPEATYPASDKTATLTFLLANPQTADRLSTFVEARIVGMQKSKIEEVTLPGAASEGGGKKWKITFTGKPKEDAYGSQGK